MPTDTNENSSSITSMSTVVNDSKNNNNDGVSSSSITITSPTTNHTQSPPLSSSLQTPTTTRSISPTQIPPKQLDKLRCFLSTLYYFGADISNDIGEHVRALILALVVSHI